MEKTTNIKDYESYIDKQVKGFKFDSVYCCEYNESMDKYIGVVGTIIEWDSYYNNFVVEFEEVIWCYPADLVIKQLEQKEELTGMMEKDEESGVYDDSEEDVVNNPSHYTDGKIEVIDFIEDKKLGFHLGNSVKYISRAGKKDPGKRVEDIKKAIWYLERYITRL